MTRGPRPHRALAEAIPIAKARGFIQMTLSGPERVFDIAIISKIPVTFARVMFLRRSLRPSSGLPMISKKRSPTPHHCPRRCYHCRGSGSGQSTGRGGSSWSRRTHWSRSTARGNGSSRYRRYRTLPGLLLEGRNHPLPKKPLCFPGHTGARIRSGYTSFPSPSHFHEVIICKNAEPGTEYPSDLRREWTRSHLAELQQKKGGVDGVSDVVGNRQGVFPDLTFILMLRNITDRE